MDLKDAYLFRLPKTGLSLSYFLVLTYRTVLAAFCFEMHRQSLFQSLKHANFNIRSKAARLEKLKDVRNSLCHKMRPNNTNKLSLCDAEQ